METRSLNLSLVILFSIAVLNYIILSWSVERRQRKRERVIIQSIVGDIETVAPAPEPNGKPN